jgi:putative ABC transport system substrate-binding protein
MRRIGLAVVLAVTLLAPLASEAQQAWNIPRIGILTNAAPSQNSPTLEAFRQGLRELGYVEGQNILLADLAAELVSLKVDVILASGPMIQARTSPVTAR